MSDGFPWPIALVGYLVPAGVILLAAGASRPAESGRTAVWGLLGAAAGFLGYVVFGFGIEFGGLGLVSDLPGAEAMRREVPPLLWGGRVVGREWGLVGLGGLIHLEGTLPREFVILSLHEGAAAAAAAAIAAVSLSGRVRLGVTVILGAVIGALLYPIFGNWLWGGGWLGRLDESLALGIGAVDAAGAAHTYGVGAMVGLGGMVLWKGRRQMRRDLSQPPKAELPLVAVLGSLLLSAGWAGHTLAGPPFTLASSGPEVGLNLAMAASAGALVAALYLGFVRGEVELLLAARGLVAGLVAASGGAAFLGPLAAVGVGAVAGLLLPLITYVMEVRLGLLDPAGVAGAFLAPAVWGLLAIGLFADGSGGVLGLLTNGAPLGQLAAQILGVAALAALGAVVWLGLAILDRGFGSRIL